MGKGDRKRREPLPKLAATTPTPHKGSRKNRARPHIATEEPADRVALDTRCRHAGKPVSDEHRAWARAQWLEGDIGKAIWIFTGKDEEAQRLWKVYLDWDIAEAVYFRRVLGKDRFAKTAKIEMMPERMEARADDKPDLRSEDEKHRDAVNNWMKWRGYIGHLETHERQSLFDGALYRYEVHSYGNLTGSGKEFCKALARLADIVEKLTNRRKIGNG
jgi:hypothetical protein